MTARAKNIIVVGAPRSGTSLTAGVFARKGYFVGSIEEEHMREGDDGNPFGYFEADELIERNVEVFRRAGFPHHNTWLFEAISEAAIARIASLDVAESDRAFARSYDARSPWMWKDPRLCFTLGYWWKLMDPSTTAVIIVRRAFDHIHNSFRRRGWCAEGEEAKARLRERIDRHVGAAEATVTSLRIPHLSLRYEDFLEQPGMVAAELSDFCGVSFAVGDLNVRPELNHTSARGRLSARLRISLERGWLRHIRFVRPLVPRRVLSLLFPERKYERKP